MGGQEGPLLRPCVCCLGALVRRAGRGRSTHSSATGGSHATIVPDDPHIMVQELTGNFFPVLFFP